MAAHPDMILQFSHYLAEEKRRQGRQGAANHAACPTHHAAAGAASA